MSKNDGDRDETPIQFAVPRIYSREGRAPTPVNQPHWEYKSITPSRPTFGGWLVMIMFYLLMIALIYFALTEIPDVSKWVVAGIASAMLISVTWFMIRSFFYTHRQEKNVQDGTPIKRVNKKQTKRRKDNQ